MKSSQPDRGALLLMMIPVAIWGSGWVVMKYLVPFVGAFDLVVLRYGLGFLTLLLIQLLLRQRFTLPPFWLTIGIAVFQTTGYQCLAQLALIYGGTGRVVMVAYTMPFWVVLFAWAILGDRPTQRHMFGFCLAAVGLLAVVSPWEGLGTLTSSLLALTAGACWGMGTVLSKVMFQRYTPNVLNLTTWQMLLGTLMTLPFALIVTQPPIRWEPEMIWGIIYLGIMASAVAWALWLFIVRRVNAVIAGMSGLGVPMLTIVLAWALLGEQPTVSELGGILLMMAGLVIVNLAPVKSDGQLKQKVAM